MKTVRAEIPLKPSEIVRYTKLNVAGEDFNVVLDVNDCKLSNKHIFNYLSHLKIDCEIAGFTPELIYDYIITSDFIGYTNLVKYHANTIYYQKYGTLYYDLDVNVDYESIPHINVDVINSLPMFVMSSCGKLKCEKIDNTIQEGTGVNFAHLVRDKNFFVAYLGGNVGDLYSTYYTYHFDKFIYGGDKLIQHFMDYDDNLLLKLPDIVSV